MHIWTNRPYEALWDHLDFLSHSANVTRLLTGGLPSERTVIIEDQQMALQKASQIAHSIRQAHEYFLAADSVSIATSPLLYYYGVLSLSKALIVANTPDLLLDDIKYHGLFTRPITEELQLYSANPNNWSMEDEFAVTNDGVFKHLTKLIHGVVLPDQSVIKYKDILVIEPEISDMYYRYYGAVPRVQYIYDHKEQDNPYKLTIEVTTKDHEIFENLFPPFKTEFERQIELKHNTALVYDSLPTVKEFPKAFGIYYPVAGGRYLVGGLRYKSGTTDTERYFCPEICDYISFFILSNCVRYKQEFWGNIIEGKTDGALGLLSLCVNIARSRFPNFVLNEFYNEKFSFGASAKVM